MAANPNVMALQAALQRIGWSNEAQVAFTDEGFGDITEIGLVTRDFIAQTCKKIRTGRPRVAAAGVIAAVPAILPVTIPALNEYKLYGMHLWVTEMQGRGTAIQAQDFDAATATLYTQRVREDFESKGRKDDEIVKIPDAFGWETDWMLFYKLLVNYLGTKLGCSNIPLEYVVRREDDVAPPGTVFVTDHERLVASTPHTGSAFAEDNGKVWTVIKQLTLNGPAFAYIGSHERTRNGRGAIKSLISHYEGESNMSKTKQQAYDDMTNLVYSGERRNFTFETYVNRHSKAHMILAEYNETLAESKKVDDFLRGIQDPSTVMLAGKANVYGSSSMRNSFSEASNYLSNFVLATPKTNTRRIGALESSSGRGRGRGRFTTRGSGRGGRTGGRHGTRGGGGRSNLTARNYTADQWSALSKEQKDLIIKLRNESRSPGSSKRSASSVNTADSTNDSSSGPTNAGDQFAHANKKSK